MNDLIAGLLKSQAYPHPAPAPRLIETHISWVILAGDYAYKLKKPLDLGFLDFSTLDKRHACCDAEIRLNRRLAPDTYLEVVPVTGTPEVPRMGGDGPALEWAVRMRAFPADATLDREAEVTPEQIDAIADRVARFHEEIAPAPADGAFGAPDKVMAPVAANFALLRAILPSPPAGGAEGQGTAREPSGDARTLSPALPPGGRENPVQRLDRLEAWSLAEGERLRPHFAARKAGGFVRECHGDLHLGNIAWIPDTLPPLEKGGGGGFVGATRTEPGEIPPSPPFPKGGINHFAAHQTGGFARECHGDQYPDNIARLPDTRPPLEKGGGGGFVGTTLTEPDEIPPSPPFPKGGIDHFTAHQTVSFARECHGNQYPDNIARLPDSLPPLEKGGGGGFVGGALAKPGEIPPNPPFPKGGIDSLGELPDSREKNAETGIEKALTNAPTNPLIFDAIEFNPDLRFIDVINEIAFLTMDLRHRGRDDLAWRCLNRYLEHTGDYAGLAALPYYQVYRAMVRAKVSAILASQHDGDFSECHGYLALADRLAHKRGPALVLMHGVSGSGKTWYSQTLLEKLGAVRLRSDVERKRLFGLSALESSADIPGGIYTPEAGQRTLERLLELARGLLQAGFTVIVDATFIRRDWREPFAALATELALPWFIAAAEADPDILRARLTQRLAQNMAGKRDASEAGPDVLEEQLAAIEPFTATERARVLSMNNGMEQALSRIQAT